MIDEIRYLGSDSDDIFKMIQSCDAASFSSLAKLAYERYSVPEDVFVRNCRRILVNSHVKYVRIKRRFGLFTPVYFRIYYLLLKLSFIFLPKHEEGVLKADIAFELWSMDGNHNYRFYQKIHEQLPKEYTVAFFVNNMPKGTVDGRFMPNIFFSNSRPDSDLAYEVASREGLTLPNNDSGVDSYFLWSGFLRQYLIYATHAKNLKTSVFITAGDNYMTPLRYWLMKRAGISTIISIQNGSRTNCIDSGGAYYNECDVYEVYGKKQRELLKAQGCRAQTWLTMGSIPLINKLQELDVREDGGIVVIGHDFSYRIGDYNADDFNIILAYLRAFSRKYQTRILYKARTGSQNEMDIYRKYLESEWTVFDASVDAYQAVSNATVCVGYISTLGSEALGLCKKVLTFNFYGDDLVMGEDDGFGVVLNRDYSEFERKLLLLLQASTPEVAMYYEKMRLSRMNLDANVFSFLSKLCMASVERA